MESPEDFLKKSLNEHLNESFKDYFKKSLEKLLMLQMKCFLKEFMWGAINDSLKINQSIFGKFLKESGCMSR